MTILIAGGSGFLGRHLASRLAQEHTVLTLTRRPTPTRATDIAWNPDGTAGSCADTVAAADVIINLAGEGIADKRWTDARKRLLHDSRIRATQSLVAAIHLAPPRPRLLISGSAIGYYGPHGDEPVTETTPPGADFLARLCVAWESEAARAAAPDCRVTALRTGIVLHPRGGALARMLTPFRLGLGGPMGSGRQFMPWIHIDDWVALVIHIVRTSPHAEDATAAAGAMTAYNLSAPTPVTNADFSHTLARVLGRPALLRAPAFALNLALGELATAALLSGARVLPARAEAENFRFDYAELEPALRNLLGRA